MLRLLVTLGMFTAGLTPLTACCNSEPAPVSIQAAAENSAAEELRNESIEIQKDIEEHGSTDERQHLRIVSYCPRIFDNLEKSGDLLLKVRRIKTEATPETLRITRVTYLAYADLATTCAMIPEFQLTTPDNATEKMKRELLLREVKVMYLGLVRWDN